MHNFEIKEIKKEEIEKVKPLLFKLRKFESKFDKELIVNEKSIEKMLLWMKKKLKEGFIFACFFENEIVAYIFGYIEKRSENYWKTFKVGYICDLYVEKEFRKKGIGKGLIKKAEDWFKEKGISIVFLGVYSKNEALDFYKKLGYKEESIKLFIYI